MYEKGRENEAGELSLLIDNNPDFESDSISVEDRSKLILRTISAYSPSGREANIAELIKEELISRGLPARIDQAGNVLCEVGYGSPSVMMCGHMDTVPGELDAKIEGDLVYGRGACDAKGALMSLLFAFEDLAPMILERNEGRLVFGGVTEEERSSAGLMELIRNDLKTDFAIFGEPGGMAKVTIGYRGHLTTRLEISTPEVHASAPKLTTNSIELFYEIYSKIKHDLNAVESESTSEVSVSVTEISGGSAHNVIPGNVRATIDVRIPIGSSTDKAKQQVETTITDIRKRYPIATLIVTFDEPTEPYKIRLDSPLIRAINRSILKMGQKMTLISKSGTGDMNTYALAFGVDAITYGPGEAKLSHTSEEVVRLSEIFECSNVIKGTVLELLAMTKRSAPRRD